MTGLANSELSLSQARDSGITSGQSQATQMAESGDLEKGTVLTKELFKTLLDTKIDTLHVENAIAEVKPFIKDTSVFDFWSKDYFKLLAERIKFSD